MTPPDQPTFTVDPSGDPVVIRVFGRANYLTSGPLNQLFCRLIEKGKRGFLVDFSECSGMDSTFLGILAGATLRLLRETPKGRVDACNLNERNLELLHNLGLHRFVNIRTGKPCAESIDSEESETLQGSTVEAQAMLDAHRSLIEADAENKGKFQDVIQFLEQELD